MTTVKSFDLSGVCMQVAQAKLKLDYTKFIWDYSTFIKVDPM